MTVPQLLRAANVSVWVADQWAPLGAADCVRADGVRLLPPVAAQSHFEGGEGGRLARLRPSARQDARIAYNALLLADIRSAAVRLRGPSEPSRSEAGLVEFRCTPDVATNAAAIVAQAEQALHATQVGNVMIGLPAGEAGLAALQELTYRGMNAAVDDVFCTDRYDEVAEAYVRGLERRLHERRPLAGITSVAWLPVAPLGERVDAILRDDSPLRGAVAVAIAHQLYVHANRRFSGPRWRRLAAHGARPHRLGFSEVSVGHSGRRDLTYVERLALPGTLMAVPSPLLDAERDGERLAAVEPDETEVAWVLHEAALQIRLRAIASDLQRKLHARRTHTFHRALHAIADRLTPVDAARGELYL